MVLWKYKCFNFKIFLLKRKLNKLGVECLVFWGFVYYIRELCVDNDLVFSEWENDWIFYCWKFIVICVLDIVDE